MRPFIYSVCDQGYYDQYADAFLNSARAAGHETKLFCDHVFALDDADRAHYIAWRFRLLPSLLKTRPAVLMVDIDSIIRRPIELADDIDLGIFLRPDRADRRKRTLGTVFYCTSRAMEFAQAMAERMRGEVAWSEDQAALWDLYEEMGGRFKVARLDERFVSWAADADALIYTGKGSRKMLDNNFVDAVEKYRCLARP